MIRKKIAGLVSGLLGLFLLIYAVYPILIYEVQSQVKFAKYLLPVPEDRKFVYAQEPEMADYSDPNNWFPSASSGQVEVARVNYYSVTIPSLKIKNATVAVGGEDLSDSLIQYPGTALPGKNGNTVIFGHSVLPAFFNPKDYLTIFSTLPMIEEGDEVLVNYDGINYDYEILDMFEVDPTAVEILEQNSGSSYLTLVTCVPPGHPLRPKRLVVRAKLVEPDTAKIYEISRN